VEEQGGTVLELIERARASPVIATVFAGLLMILGILVIVYPGLIAWIAGIALVLGGIAILASLFMPRDRSNS
jgi:hypothetical protein